jgi:membrane-anchored glycerophosphoryl diester phosphodiesterase (GDPDase)
VYCTLQIWFEDLIKFIIKTSKIFKLYEYFKMKVTFYVDVRIIFALPTTLKFFS